MASNPDNWNSKCLYSFSYKTCYVSGKPDWETLWSVCDVDGLVLCALDHQLIGSKLPQAATENQSSKRNEKLTHTIEYWIFWLDWDNFVYLYCDLLYGKKYLWCVQYVNCNFITRPSAVWQASFAFQWKS